jgi:hypothetical protein
MKTIIKRNLDLNKKYFFVSKTYISLIDGYGTTCANCNKLIANIATVKDEDNKVFNIGLDCLETLMLNNEILKGVDIDFKEIKKQLQKVKRGLSNIKEFIEGNKNINIDTINVEYSSMFGDWVSYYYYSNNKCIWNDGDNLKNIDIELFIQSLKDNFKDITINLIDK